MVASLVHLKSRQTKDVAHLGVFGWRYPNPTAYHWPLLPKSDGHLCSDCLDDCYRLLGGVRWAILGGWGITLLSGLLMFVKGVTSHISRLTLLRGLKKTMVINHLQVIRWSSKYNHPHPMCSYSESGISPDTCNSYRRCPRDERSRCHLIWYTSGGSNSWPTWLGGRHQAW